MFSFLMGNKPNVSSKISFEDVQFIIKDNRFLLISTLDASEQNCLISGTINIEKEVDIINGIKNKLINKYFISIYLENKDT